jgi:hypothetical protein
MKIEAEQKEIMNAFKIQCKRIHNGPNVTFIIVRTIWTPVKFSQVSLSNSNLCLMCQNQIGTFID